MEIGHLPQMFVTSLVPQTPCFVQPEAHVLIPNTPGAGTTQGPITCYNCGELGHLSGDCPKPKAPNQEVKVVPPWDANEETDKNKEEADMVMVEVGRIPTGHPGRRILPNQARPSPHSRRSQLLLVRNL